MFGSLTEAPGLPVRRRNKKGESGNRGEGWGGVGVRERWGGGGGGKGGYG